MSATIKAEQIAQFNKKLETVSSIDDLIGKGGAITELFQNTLQTMLESELNNHLGYEKGTNSRKTKELKGESNKRNGYRSRSIKSSQGNLSVEIPRDRQGSFESKILDRYQKNTNEIEQKIICLYGKGMTLQCINEHIEDMYGVEISKDMLSNITEKIRPEIEAWKSRSLESCYPIVYVDAIHLKIRENNVVENKACYLVYGINIEGHKDILGMWIGESESSKFWLGVYTDLKNRGLSDILIICSDNLAGMSEAIHSVYPEAQIQKCVVHQIRNSLKHISHKHKKEFLQDLKPVYKANTKDEAEYKLLQLEEKWNDSYPIVIKSWQENWEELSQYFQYSQDIRTMIYTTNPIENVNGQIRSVTKNRRVFPSKKSAEKLVYLSLQRIINKWTMPVQNWALKLSQLAIHFPNKINIKI